MRVLITGAYGFIGYSVAVRLLNEGHSVIGIDKVREARSEKTKRIAHLSSFPKFQFHDVNLSDFTTADVALSAMGTFDVILHLAGQYSVRYTTDNLLAFIDGNLRSFLHVMDYAQRKEIKRVVYASSTFVQDATLSESMYGATLEFRERSANVYAAMGMQTVGIRFGSVYGPHMRPDTGIYITAKKLTTGQPINVEEGGFSYKSGFVYIDDAVESVIRLLTLPLQKNHNVFTLVAEDVTRDLGEALDYLELHTGFRAKRTGNRKESPSSLVGIERIQPLIKQINYSPATQFPEGMKKFSDWWMGEHVTKTVS